MAWPVLISQNEKAFKLRFSWSHLGAVSELVRGLQKSHFRPSWGGVRRGERELGFLESY